MKNNQEIKNLIKEYTKGLPKELTKSEIKHLTEEERQQRNKKISIIKSNIKKLRQEDDDFHNYMYCIIYNQGTEEEKKDLPLYKEGAYRTQALNAAIKICNNRFIWNDKENKIIKKNQKSSIKDFRQGFKEALQEYKNKN